MNSQTDLLIFKIVYHNNMDFLDLAKSRFSARSYLNKPIEKENLDYILEAARIAPSAANKQAFCIYLLTDGEIRDKINSTYGRDWIKQAPVLLVICADENVSCMQKKKKKGHGDIDATIAIDHITLAAAEKGLATCWICHFDIEECIKILNLDPNIIPMAMLPLGYSNEKPEINRQKFQRKPLGEILKSI